jgi:hypothetical protein
VSIWGSRSKGSSHVSTQSSSPFGSLDEAVHRHHQRGDDPSHDGQREWEALGRVERIADLDDDLASKVRRACLTEGGERMLAIGAVEDDLAECGRLGEGADLGLASHAAKPCLAGIAVGRARTHHDPVTDLHKSGGDGVADHAGAEDCDPHDGSPLRDRLTMDDAVCRQAGGL